MITALESWSRTIKDSSQTDENIRYGMIPYNIKGTTNVLYYTEQTFRFIEMNI